jgi:hypothetical protein
MERNESIIMNRKESKGRKWKDSIIRKEKKERVRSIQKEREGVKEEQQKKRDMSIGRKEMQVRVQVPRNVKTCKNNCTFTSKHPTTLYTII